MSTFVTSRVNGLKIAIPADARGVVSRFASQGDNRLTFQPGSQQARQEKAEAMRIETSQSESEQADDFA